MKLLIRVLGGVGAVMVGFVVTLALIDYFGVPVEEKRLAQGATELMQALEHHKILHGKFPVFAGNDRLVVDVVSHLASMGLPSPAKVDFAKSRYVSYDGKSYGLLLPAETPSGA